MNLSPEQEEIVLRMVADNITNELRETAGGSFSNWFLIPLKTVAQMVGMTTKQLPRRLPITEFGPSSHGVLWGTLQAHLLEKTKQPRS